MKLKTKWVLAIIAITILAIPRYTHQQTKEAPTPAPEEPSLRMPPNTKEALEKRLEEIAKEKGLPENKVQEIKETIGGVPGTKCPSGESTWNPNAIGDGGTSHGLVQIHLPAHPDITEEQAHDPEFALNFIVDEFKQGNEKKWTCWRETQKVAALPYPTDKPAI